MTQKLTVVCARNSKDEPCIKLSDKQLSAVGFSLGDLISVTYKRKTVITKRLTKINYD